MWSVIRALPEAIRFVRSLLSKMSVQETKELLRDNAKKVREIDEDHDESPLDTTIGFFGGGGGVRDSNDSE